MKKILLPLLALWALVVFGCGGDDNGNGPPPVEKPPRLVADTTVTAPSLSAVDEAVWFQVDSVEIKIGKNITYGRNPVLGERSVWMKAIKKGGKLYIRAQWRDASANLKADVVRCSSDELNTWEQVTSTGQDVFSLILDAQNNGVEGADCASMCHTPLMKTTGGGNADVWKWTSTSTRPALLAEDKWITADTTDHDRIEDSFYDKDVFILNYGLALPRKKHPDTTDFHGIVLYRDIAVDFLWSDNIDIPWPTGYEMPGYVVDSTIFNDPNRTNDSWFDVRAISHYDSTGLEASNYTWTVVFERALNTGHADDVDLSNLDSVMVTIAATHNSVIDQHTEHSGSEPFYLILKP